MLIGLLVPDDDVSAMSAAVLRLLSEPNLVEKLSKNARRQVEQYDWGMVLQDWEMLFRQIVYQQRV